jgi:porphobilinogen synthase
MMLLSRATRARVAYQRLRPAASGACDLAATTLSSTTTRHFPLLTSAAQRSYTPPASHLLHPSLSHDTMKTWQAAGREVTASSLMFPIFVAQEANAKEAVASLPGQYRWGVDRLEEMLRPLVAQGLRSVLLFGVVDGDAVVKDNEGSYACADDAPVPRALRRLRAAFPQLLLSVDVCLCGYTDHGHCGVLVPSNNTVGGPPLQIDNQQSIDRLAAIAVAYARAGAHQVSPSDMMDGRIGAIKEALATAGFARTVSVMAYSAKFASCFYGPFRDAACSGMAFGDRSGYQLAPMARSLALRAVERDAAEGADVVQVKPAMAYLDIIREARDFVRVPVAAYHVSGEYAALWHGAAAGAFDLEECVMESLGCLRRAGADILITYYAPNVLQWLENANDAAREPPSGDVMN